MSYSMHMTYVIEKAKLMQQAKRTRSRPVPCYGNVAIWESVMRTYVTYADEVDAEVIVKLFLR
jgi:hypothetical protein